jgi:hypothetical protein
MIAHILVGWRRSFVTIQNLKCNAEVLHLLPYFVLPKSVGIFFAQSHAVIPTLWEFNSKLVSPIVVTLGCIINDTDVLLEHIWEPPNKSMGIMQVLGYIIVINFHRVALLEVCKALPTCCPIFPFNAQVPIFGFIPDLRVTSMLDVHISVFHNVIICIVINNEFHQVESIAFLIKLGIHVLCYHICSVFITALIRKLNLISSGIQHRIGIGLPFHSSIKFMIAPHDLPILVLITNWNSDLSANILVITFNVINVINVRHLISRTFVIFIRIIIWSLKICAVRIILEIIFGHRFSIFLINLYIKSQASLIFSWRCNLIRGEGSHRYAVHHLPICLQDLACHHSSSVNCSAKISSQLNLGNSEVARSVTKLNPFIPSIFCHCGDARRFILHPAFRNLTL